MEENQLVKEIITTTTERYGDNGNVKEKVTESREKIYSTAFSEEQIQKAKPIEPQKEKVAVESPSPSSPKPEVKTQEDKIKEAAAAIDAQKQETVYDKAKNTTPNPFENMPKPQDPFAAWQQQQKTQPTIPQYNVANRGTQSVTDPTKFPWET